MIERSLGSSFHFNITLREESCAGRKLLKLGIFLESTLRKKRNSTFAKTNFRVLVKIMNFS